MSFRDWFRPKPAPPQSGVTLQPGESMNLELPEPLAADLTRFSLEGRDVRFNNGPIRCNGSRFSRHVKILVDGKLYGGLDVEWTE